jgi:vitamin B12 transporter
MTPPLLAAKRPLPRRLAFALLTSALTPACVTAASAQEPAAPPVALPTLVVSPTGVPTPIDQVANSVTVITAADIEREQRRTVPDVLSTVPGLNVIQAGGPGALSSIFMRGTNPNHVKILIDGIDVSDPSNTARVFDVGQMLTGDIDRIEVLRGPQSGLYGADALGGVIAITTKKGEGPPRFATTLEAGSFRTFNQTASLSGSTDRFDYAFNALHFRAADTPVTPLALLPPGRARIGDFYDNVTASTKLGAAVTDNLSANFVARYTDATYRFTGDDFSTFPSAPAASQSTQVVHQFFTRGEAVWSLWDGRFKNYFGLAYTDHWNWSGSPGSAPTVNKGDRTKLDWRGVVALMPGQTLVLGLERENERLRTVTVAADNGNSAGYVELQTSYADRFFLVANARLDDNDAFGSHATYRVAPAVIVPFSETKLKGSVGSAFKAPTLSQLYVDFPAFNFFGNPALKPEESTGYDIGFEQPVWGGRARFGATYFHNDITNLITSNATFTSYDNIGSAETSGVEAFVFVKLTDRLKVRGDYTYTKAIDATTGLELLRRPRHKASATAYWDPTDRLSLSATVLRVSSWVDGNRDFSIPRLTAPGYTVVNLAADYMVNENLKVFGRIDNLFNEQYQDPTGFMRPGFAVFGGMRLANR